MRRPAVGYATIASVWPDAMSAAVAACWTPSTLPTGCSTAGRARVAELDEGIGENRYQDQREREDDHTGGE